MIVHIYNYNLFIYVKKNICVYEKNERKEKKKRKKEKKMISFNSKHFYILLYINHCVIHSKAYCYFYRD